MHRPANSPAVPLTEAQENQRRIHRAAVLRRRATAGLCAVSMLFQQACYNRVPVEGSANIPKGLVTIEINDRGRLLVGEKLGTLLDNVTGHVVSADSVNVQFAVDQAEDARGRVARWGGERFTIPREGIATMNEKKASKWRSLLLAGGIVVGLVVAALTLNSSRFGGDDGPVGPGMPI